MTKGKKEQDFGKISTKNAGNNASKVIKCILDCIKWDNKKNEIRESL